MSNERHNAYKDMLAIYIHRWERTLHHINPSLSSLLANVPVLLNLATKVPFCIAKIIVPLTLAKPKFHFLLILDITFPLSLCMSSLSNGTWYSYVVISLSHYNAYFPNVSETKRHSGDSI